MSMIAQADATKLPLADQSVDLVIGSPPYCDARDYGMNAQRPAAQWVDWMLDVTTEACRVSRGLVLWVCAGVSRKRCYWPAPEGLMWEWYKRGNQLWRPAFWHRVGIPGSGGKQWLRADVEYVLAFKRDAEWLPWADNTANGHPPKWGPGGEMSHRVTAGMRINQWGHPIGTGGTAGSADDVTCGAARPSHIEIEPKPMYRRGQDGRRANGERKRMLTDGNLPPGSSAISFPEQKREHSKRLAGGSMETQVYIPPTLANPGCLIKGIKVGGGLMGHPMAHENEAPFPVDLPAWFIRGWCPRGGTVLDPFSGSGTTCDAAWREGRIGIGFDLRMNQCVLGSRRLVSPNAAKKKAKKPRPESSLFAEAI